MAYSGNGHCGCHYDSECNQGEFCWIGPGVCDYPPDGDEDGGNNLTILEFCF